MSEPEARARLDVELRKGWKAFLERKGISEQAAMARMIRNVIRMDDLAASLLLDQITDPKRRKQATEILLRELGKRRGK